MPGTRNTELWNGNTLEERAQVPLQPQAPVLSCLQTLICHTGGSRERQAPSLQPLLPGTSQSQAEMRGLARLLHHLSAGTARLLPKGSWSLFCCLAAWRSWKKSVSADPKYTWTLPSSEKRYLWGQFALQWQRYGLKYAASEKKHSGQTPLNKELIGK